MSKDWEDDLGGILGNILFPNNNGGDSSDDDGGSETDFEGNGDDSNAGDNSLNDGLDALRAEDPPIDPVYPVEDALGAMAGGEAAEALGELAGEGIGMAAEDASALADQIADGHAFDDHVVDEGQFPDITTPEEFSDHIEGILTDPDEVRSLERDRTAYWDEESGTLVIHDPNHEDGGTAFVPEDGSDFFDDKSRLKQRRRCIWK